MSVDSSDEPVKQAYVRELAGYYRHLGQVYNAGNHQPWARLEPLNDPPDRPASLPGRIDPVTSTPPEVIEALDHLTETVAGVLPITR